MDIPSDYELLEEIGRGEWSTVHRARDLVLRRPVAIRELHERHRGDARLLEQFLDGARLLAGQKHDAIVQVFGVCSARGWVVMELMRGGVDRLAGRGGLDRRAVRPLLRQSLEALGFLHAQGRLHGAIKPSNLLIDDAGRLKLSDATGAPPDGELRRPSGLPRYLAPELLSREFGEPGPASDLYSLGLVFLEQLAGVGLERLVQGVLPDSSRADLDWMRWHGSPEKQWPPAAGVAPGLPPDLAEALDRMIRKPVAARSASADEVLAGLADDRPGRAAPRASGPGASSRSRASSPDPEPARSPHPSRAGDPIPPAADPVKRPRRSNRPADPPRQRIRRYLERPAVLYSVCAALIVPTLLFVLVPQKPGGASPPPGPSKGPSGNLAPPPEVPPPTTSLPIEQKPAPPHLPGERNCFLGHEGPIRSVAISGDARFAVSGGHDNTVRFWDLKKGREIAHPAGPTDLVVESVSMSADGRRALSADSSGILRSWDVPEGHLVREFGYRQGSIYSARLTPDGRSALAGGLHSDAPSYLHLWDAESGTPIGALPGARDEVWCIAISRDGREALTYGVDRIVRLWDLRDRREIARFPRVMATIQALALAPSCNVAYLATAEGLILRWDIRKNSEVSPPIHDHDGPINGIDVDATGRVLLTGGSDGTLRAWDCDDMRPLARLRGHAGRIRCVALSDDGLAAVSGGDDQTVRLWNLGDSEEAAE